jgi:hypothetical protein
MLQLFARRAGESNVFSIRNTLWSRVEDDLLVQVVVKYSTSDVLMYTSSLSPFIINNSISSHRNLYIGLLFTSRFITS